MTEKIYDGLYEVTSEGQVYSNVKYKNRTEMVGKVANSGYRMIILTIAGKRIYKNVHRLIAETFVPNPENKPEVNHIDGNKLNNDAKNLEWVTATENQIHCRDNLYRKCQKLNKDKANEIRKLYNTEQYSFRKLAKEFDVGKTIIGQIINNERWRPNI